MPVAPTETAITAENQQTDEPSTYRFSWTVENFSRLGIRKHYSEVFIVGGYKWWVDLHSFFYRLFQHKS